MITSIRLQNFRSYKDESFEFEPGVNIVVGPNASGKTNLLEAVMVLAAGSSFKAKDVELVKFSAPWARLDGIFKKQTRTLKLDARGGSLDKTLEIDGKIYKRLSLERSLPIVFFEPNQLQLLIRGPKTRREYMDELLERTVPGFKPLSGRYRRCLAQRNALLKSRAAAAGQLFVWDVRVAELGGQIAAARQELADSFNKNLSVVYSRIAGRKSKARLDYLKQFPAGDYASRLLSRLQKTQATDLAAGFTASGPHREDFAFFINDRPAQVSASRGETRSLILALKSLELDLVEKARDQKPILLLDDVFSELDGKRRQELVGLLKNHQSILTTTDAELVIEHFSKSAKLLPLS